MRVVVVGNCQAWPLAQTMAALIGADAESDRARHKTKSLTVAPARSGNALLLDWLQRLPTLLPDHDLV